MLLPDPAMIRTLPVFSITACTALICLSLGMLRLTQCPYERL